MLRFGLAVFVHLFAFAFLQLQQPEETVTISISQGALRGKVETSPVTGQKYYSFLGIPFGKPPLGALRFKGPQAAESWSGVRDATAEGPVCFQRGTGSEDCLLLNVVTPELPGSRSGSQLKPVMVWVHGGAYQAGSGNLSTFGPDYLLQRGVVFVTINYRLGVLGFLSVPGSDAAGNAGLKDQVAALRWVKANINKFGGDPHSVTLFGESAGGSAVHHQMLSPLSTGLFERAISESGAAMNPTAFFKSMRDRAFRLGKYLGLDTHDGQELVNFFRSVPVEKLVAAQNKGLSDEESEKPIMNAFLPTIEHPVDGEEVFLAASPWELTKKGQFKKLPYITGVNKDEGILAYTVCSNSACLDKVDRDFEIVVPLNLGLCKGSEQSKEVAARLRQFYFKDKKVSMETKQNYIDLQTDAMYASGCHYVVKHSAAHNISNVFNYQFVYEGKLGSATHPPNVQGVAHGEELYYIFYQQWLDQVGPSSEDKSVTNTMVTMWTDFAKTGNPSISKEVSWKYVSQDHLYYLKINATPSLQEDFSKERMALWDAIFTYVGF